MTSALIGNELSPSLTGTSIKCLADLSQVEDATSMISALGAAAPGVDCAATPVTWRLRESVSGTASTTAASGTLQQPGVLTAAGWWTGKVFELDLDVPAASCPGGITLTGWSLLYDPSASTAPKVPASELALRGLQSPETTRTTQSNSTTPLDTMQLPATCVSDCTSVESTRTWTLPGAASIEKQASSQVASTSNYQSGYSQRTKVTTNRSYPNSATGILDAFYSKADVNGNDTRTRASSAVGYNTVSTAAHCLFGNDSLPGWPSAVRWYPGASGTVDDHPFGHCWWNQGNSFGPFVTRGWAAEGDYTYDYGAVYFYYCIDEFDNPHSMAYTTGRSNRYLINNSSQAPGERG